MTTMATKCMLDHSFKPLAASAIATGILYHTRETAGCVPGWTSALNRLTCQDTEQCVVIFMRQMSGGAIFCRI